MNINSIVVVFCRNFQTVTTITFVYFPESSLKYFIKHYIYYLKISENKALSLVFDNLY